MTESGRSIFFSSKPSISACASIAGPKEGKGRFGDLFDIVLEEDLLGQISWEMGESEMLRRTAELPVWGWRRPPAILGMKPWSPWRRRQRVHVSPLPILPMII